MNSYPPGPLAVRVSAPECRGRSALLEEIEDQGGSGAAGRGVTSNPDEEKVRRRLIAGLLVETGLADKSAAKRWREAVLSGSWDADACASEIVASAPPSAYSEQKLQERAARLERDLLMAAHMRGVRGASRRVRGATRSATAFMVANIVAILVYSAVIAALLIIARIGYDWSIDGLIDRLAGVFGKG